MQISTPTLPGIGRNRGQPHKSGPAHKIRLALVYALLDRSPSIDVPPEAAVAVWDYAEQSVSYSWATQPAEKIANTILQMLRTIAGGLSRTQIRDLLGRDRLHTRSTRRWPWLPVPTGREKDR